MKTNFLKKIVDETVVEVEATWQETVDRLRAQGAGDSNARVKCSEWGKIITYLRYGQYYLEGEVVVENNKTLVKIYTVYDRTMPLFSGITTVLDLLVLAIFVPLMYINNNGLNFAEIMIAVALLLVGVYGVLKRFELNRNTPQNLTPTKNLLLKMIDAVDKWDK